MKKFTRTIEDFACEQCGHQVQGDGYTNHCPECLWSKHVDVHPGDRAAECGGLMEPVGVEFGADKQIVIQQCVDCGHQRKNKVQKDDNERILMQL